MKHFFYKTLFLISILFSATFISAQENKQNYKLSHEMSADELLRKHEIGKSFVETLPPTGDVRNIAEWEPAEGVLITYDGSFGIPYTAIAEMSQNCIVTTIVSGLSEENQVRNLYTSNNVTLSNCNFLYSAIDSWWSRDYSPWYIAVGNSKVSIVDFPYNRPRPNDDDIPVKMATFLSEDLYGMNVIQTGGNYMCDGYGVAAQTDLVTEENPSQTLAQITQKMHDFLGITNYHVTADPLGDYIKHIDCWGKFLDVDKILITQVPISDSRYADYEALAGFFAAENCSYGYPYQVYRTQSAASSANDVNPYTNSLILNNKVFVPQTGSSLDDDAIAVYQQAMPGYEIIPVLSNGWYNTDALHCRTYGIADRNMLFIKHFPLFGVQPSVSDYTISANIYQYNNLPTSKSIPQLYYKVNNGEFQNIDMSSTDQITYTANIPSQSEGSIIKYYISAQDGTSVQRTFTNPLIGAADPHTFTAGPGLVNISELKKSENFNIYPNPCSGKFFIQTDFAKDENAEISIYSVTGQLIYKNIIAIEHGNELNRIDISGANSGIYQLTLKSENKIITKKLIIQ